MPYFFSLCEELKQPCTLCIILYRIVSLEERAKNQQTTAAQSDEEKKKVYKDLENCRIEAMREVAKHKDLHAREIAARNISNNALSLKVESLSQELECVRSQSTDDLSGLETLLQKRSSQLDSMKDELKMMEEKIGLDVELKQSLKSALKESAIEAESLKEKMHRLQEQSNAAEKLNNDLEESFSSAKKSTEEQASKKHELETALREKSTEMEFLQETIKRLEAQVNKLKMDSSEEVSRIKSSETDWSTKARENEDELAEAKDKLKFSSSRHAVLQREKSDLAEKLSEVERENASLKSSLDQTSAAKTSEYDDLQKMLKKKMNSEKKLRGELAQKKQMIAILQSNEKALEEHIASLEEQINMREENDEVVSSLESDLEKAIQVSQLTALC